jgi:ankyrin repeat protein
MFVILFLLAASRVLVACSGAPPEPQAKPRPQVPPEVFEIISAARGGNLEKVAAMLEKNPALVHAQTAEGETPLLAAFGGLRINEKLVEFLIAKGADVNAHGLMRSTPLHSAASRGNAKIARLLLDHDADVNARDILNRTPLTHIYLFRPRREMAELLIARGAEVDIFAAAAFGKIARLKELLDRDPRLLESFTFALLTPLHFAALNGQVEAVKLLLERGANPERTDATRQSAADLALEAGHKELADLLTKAARERAAARKSPATATRP